MKRLAVSGILLLAAVLVGCQRGPAEPKFATAVKGKVLQNGQPIMVDKAKYGDYARVELTLIGEGGQDFTTTVNDDGTFEIQLPEGQQFPLGTYKVAVQAFEPDPNTGEDVDKLGEKFSRDNTQLTIDIQDPNNVVIDIGQAGGAAGGSQQ